MVAALNFTVNAICQAFDAMFRKREAAYRELQQRNDRQNNLTRMAGSMDMEKAVMVSCPAGCQEGTVCTAKLQEAGSAANIVPHGAIRTCHCCVG